MQRLTIAERLAIIAVLPMLAMAALSLQIGIDKFRAYERISALAPQISVAQAGANLIHELQKERGGSAGLLASKGAMEDRQRITSQRPQTNSAMEQFKIVVGHARVDPASLLGLRLADTLRQIESLPERRRAIDLQQIGISEAIAYYSAVVRSLLGVTAGLIKTVDGSGEIAALHAYRSLTMAKEAAGLERANGNAWIVRGNFEIERYRTVIELIGRQADFIAELETFATPQVLSVYRDKVTARISAPVEEMRARLHAAAAAGHPVGETSPAWWSATTARIDAMKAAEDSIAILVSERTAEGVARSWSELVWIIAVNFLIGLLVCVAVMVLSRSIIRPIARVVAILAAVEKQDYNVASPAPMPPRGEIGRVSNAMGRFLQLSIERRDAETRKRHDELADLEARRGLLATMAAKAEEATVAGLSQIIDGASDVTARTDRMQTALTRVRQASDSAAAAAATTLAANREAAELSSQIAAAIGEIGGQVHKGAGLAQAATTRAESSRASMSALVKAAHEIGEMAEVIRHVAGRTNLLALNATIEAARAGEAGRGFAVVANEVKALATQTKDATEDIAARIAAIQSATTEAAAALQAILGDIGSIDQVTVAIAAAMEQQHVATSGFAQTLHSVNEAVGNVSSRMGEIAVMVGESTEVAAQVNKVARLMLISTERAKEEIPEVVRTASKEIERRENRRFAGAGEATVQSRGRTYKSRLIEISRGGARLSAAGDLGDGDLLHVTLSTGQRLEALVAWTSDTELGVTFKGADLDAAEVRALTLDANAAPAPVRSAA